MLSKTEIAARLQLDRSTISASLKEARRRLVNLLREATGIESETEVKQRLAGIPDALRRELVQHLSADASDRNQRDGVEGDSHA